jgi:hypothetical protein
MAANDESPPTEDECVEQDDPFSTLNERVYEHGANPMELMEEGGTRYAGDRLTGTYADYNLPAYPPRAYATKHKRCLLVHTKKTEPIIYCVNDQDADDATMRPLAYWNETLQGYVVQPTKENVLELCEWLDVLNHNVDHGWDRIPKQEEVSHSPMG